MPKHLGEPSDTVGESAPGASAFGDLLREYRTRAGISQELLAERARISTAAVGALERGIRRTPYRSTVSLLAKALGLSEEDARALAAARDGARVQPATPDVFEYVPQPRTSFVGRDSDVAHIIKLFSKSRLVTITGFGGIGKTRAALEVLNRVVPDPWPDAWFVDLAPLTDGAFIAARIASSIRPPLSEGAASMADLARALASRRMLLVFDNCEHLVAEVSQAVDTLLELCPHVTILATSREPLNIAGEYVYRLPPLRLPENATKRVDDAHAYAAVELFVQRAEAADPSAVFDAENLSTVVNIVRRLDGIPLAIEVAAAQLPVIGLHALEARLEDHFNIPARRRDLPARQQTTSATIRWSYDLLTPQERELLNNVAIFAGGFALDAAEIVCVSETLERSSILPLLSSLVNKSLVQVDRVRERVRYRLLDSVRSFGVHRLRESGKETDLSRAHARWLAGIGEELYLRYDVTPPEEATRLIPEIDNIRAAITWSLDAPSQDDRGFAGQIIVGCCCVWEQTGAVDEDQRWIEIALERIDQSRHPRVVAHLLRDFIARTYFEAAALPTIERAVSLYDQIGDPRDLLDLHSGLISAYTMHDRHTDAERSAERAAAVIAAYPSLRTSAGHASFLMHRSTLRKAQARHDDARADLLEAEAISLARGDRYFVVLHCWPRLCTLELAVGNAERALEIAEEMLASEFGSVESIVEECLRIAGGLRLLLGDIDGAVEVVREMLDHPRYDEIWFNCSCAYAATVAAVRGHDTAGARLMGFVGAREERAGFRPGIGRKAVDELLRSTLSQHLSEDAIASASAQGGRLTQEQALAEAHAALDLGPAP
jgi:predicted ATPase/DNA-binding XRE family transcriptional regulator